MYTVAMLVPLNGCIVVSLRGCNFVTTVTKKFMLISLVRTNDSVISIQPHMVASTAPFPEAYLAAWDITSKVSY